MIIDIENYKSYNMFDIDSMFKEAFNETKKVFIGKFYHRKKTRQEKFRDRAYKKIGWMGNKCELSALSRKEKLALIGRKQNKNQIRKRLSKVVVRFNENWNDGVDINDMFCPRCGCNTTKSSGNMASYPEVYSRDNCMRCDYEMGWADNSPYVTYLEAEYEGRYDEDMIGWKTLGVTYIEHSDKQDDQEFKQMF